VLVLRAGIRTRPRSRLQVGRQLHLRMAQVQRLEQRGFRALAIADRRTECGPSSAAVFRELALLATTALPFGEAGSGGSGDGSTGEGAGDRSAGSQQAGPESGGAGPDGTDPGDVLSAGPNSGGQERLPSGSAAPWLPLVDGGSDDAGGLLVLFVAVGAGGVWLAMTSPLWRKP
jgi:hypothetical protein